MTGLKVNYVTPCNIQVATRCSYTVYIAAKLSSYSKIFAAPPDFFSAILLDRRGVFLDTCMVCFATMRDSLPSCWLCRRRAVYDGSLTNWLDRWLYPVYFRLKTSLSPAKISIRGSVPVLICRLFIVHSGQVHSRSLFREIVSETFARCRGIATPPEFYWISTADVYAIKVLPASQIRRMDRAIYIYYALPRVPFQSWVKAFFN